MSVPFRFIHAADLHVDSPFRGLTDTPAYVRDALMSSTFDAVSRLVETAINMKVDFVVIAGDLYDSSDRSLRAQLALQREWQQLHAHGVQLFVIHGNHDHLSGSRANLSWPESVVTFGAEQVESMPAYRRDGELAAYVYGLSYGARAITDNIAAKYKPKPDGPYHIALLHANVDGDPSYDPYAPCTLTELASAGFDYWALGHIHNRTVLHTYPHVVYPGNTQGRHSRETGAKGCYVVDVKPSKATELTFVPLDTVRWEAADVPIGGLESEQELIDSMEAAALAVLSGTSGRPAMVKIRLEGRGRLHGKLTDAAVVRELLEGVRERLNHVSWRAESEGRQWCWIYAVETMTGAELDLRMIASEDSFSGELIRGSEIMESDESLRLQLMEEAMAPLLTNPRMRSIIKLHMDQYSLSWLEQARELAAGLLTEEMEISAGKQNTGEGET
ncbi:DNA repair exonuclease [Paenibacillus sp. sptzw28]|uniref:metallophosphoesterase family protein n=1 Tax=Paenibacillus sp. sptzw28 TaxID=715179 RepID=UPI001C6E77A8|nr:DNA repair exonuclease [Paenibacillus sp. sptzw28]QYR23528.1 DNA repair exonuclease [Paenibacillus sp. sptzw28]